MLKAHAGTTTDKKRRAAEKAGAPPTTGTPRATPGPVRGTPE